MALLAVEASASVPAVTVYNSAYWTVPSGSIISQQSSGSLWGNTPIPTWIGPMYNAIARPMETTNAYAGMLPKAISWSTNLDWIFLADHTTAATTRKTQLYVLNRLNSNFTYAGYVTSTMPFRTSAPNGTIYGFDVLYQTYATGSVAVTGALVTGSVTAWSTSRLAAGSRIGFGSTIPSAITGGNWYNILSITNDLMLTLTTSASVPLASGSAYVIEDLRLVWTQVGSTAINGSGVFLTKGVAYNDFSTAGTTTYAAGASTDNQKAVYWLSDATVQVDITALGQGIATMDSWTQQYLYALDNTTNLHISKYNLRAALIPASGVDPGNALVLKTSNINTSTMVTGGNGCVATARHGFAAGVRAFYWVTTTKIYCSRDQDIVSNGIGWQSAASPELPPPNVNTYALTNALNNIAYDSVIDRFVVTTTGGVGTTFTLRSYITQFSQSTFDHIFLVDTRQINQIAGNTTDTAIYPNIVNAASTAGINSYCNNGMHYYCMVGTAATTNFLYATPIGVDWQYAQTSGMLLISPALNTPNASSYNSCYVVRDRILGSDNLGMVSGGIKTLYRTNGISNNTGSWLPVPDGNDLSGVTGAPQIQFAYAFQMISPIPLPARIYKVGVTYNDLSTLSNFQPSVGNSSVSSNYFAWRFATAFYGGTGSIPNLRVRLYDAVSGFGPLVDDNTSTPTGTWMVSTGSVVSWFSQNPIQDAPNLTTYIRYQPVTLGTGITVRALLTLL
jgi:hypothetical protein